MPPGHGRPVANIYRTCFGHSQIFLTNCLTRSIRYARENVKPFDRSLPGEKSKIRHTQFLQMPEASFGTPKSRISIRGVNRSPSIVKSSYSLEPQGSSRIASDSKLHDGPRRIVRYTNTKTPSYKPESEIAREDFTIRRAFFGRLVKTRLASIKETLVDDPIFSTVPVSATDIVKQFGIFQKSLHMILDVDSEKPSHTLKLLRTAFEKKQTKGLDLQLKYSFYGYIATARFTKAQIKNQRDLADLRRPGEWFPGSRAIQRKIHLHVGPTNSGKTYQALKRLEQVDGPGVYAGPLRLLAHEVYMRLNAAGKACHLVTGEERRAPTATSAISGSPKISCTVEMMPLSTLMKVAVIDEIQMIGDEERGWAWTQAFLGVQAEEVHLCGEPRSIPIIQELTAAIGDDLEIHRYSRLSPLQMESNSLRGNINKLQKGDCIVAFSVMTIHGLRQLIERKHNKKVAVIYGSLPPETRTQQAKLFNDPENEYDFLVASDAVGMGLNLNIKRMVFHTSYKFYANRYESLSVAEIKQIGGRAGRYSTAEADIKKTQGDNSIIDLDANAISTGDAPDSENPLVPGQTAAQIGFITTLEPEDFIAVNKAMNSDPEPITSAGLTPPASIIESFARYFPPATPFSYVLVRLHELCQMHSRFHLCNLKDNVTIADTIESVEGLTIQDKIIFCAAPISSRRQGEQELARALAMYVANNQAVSISDIEILDLELLDETATTRAVLNKLETLHKGVMLYIWLSYRFSGIFITRDLAFHVKRLVEERIEKTLASLSIDLTQIERAREMAMKQMKNIFEEALRPGEDAAVIKPPLDSIKSLDPPNTAKAFTLPDESLVSLPGRFQCSMCPRRFPDKKSLMVHKRYGAKNPATHACLEGWICNKCKESFPNSDNLILHTRKQHPDDSIRQLPCMHCDLMVRDSYELKLHIFHDHKHGKQQEIN